MRRRSTFIHAPEDAYDPAQIRIEGQDVSFSGLSAAREERLTFGLASLPDELVDVLTRSYELHIRWQAGCSISKTAPYLSSLSPGLHVYFTPEVHRSNNALCPLLHKLFSTNLRCSTPEESFVRPEISFTDFTTSSSLQYYHILPSLDQLVQYIKENICSATEPNSVCHTAADHLRHVSQLDLDYDALSSTLTLTALWPRATGPSSSWSMDISNSPLDKTELGILSSSPATDPVELQLEGFILDVGEHEEPKPTLFFFPSRHHVLSRSESPAQRYKVTFDTPTGLHPTMRISFASVVGLREPANKPEDSTCVLHSYLTLPSVLFADEYAFPTTAPDVLFQAANHVVALRSISGERDLELPDYAISKWGSSLLLQLDIPDTQTIDMTQDTAWDVTIPLHLRYLNATAGGQQHVDIPWPVVFWACTAEEGTKFRTNPFDRVNVGYDALFGERTMFYHLEPDAGPSNGKLVQTLSVPVLDTHVVSYGTVELVTLLVVMGSFLFLAQQIIRGILAEYSWRQDSAEPGQMEETKKSQ